jgi:N-acetylmuramoyl-L-alanine amidase
MIRPVKSIPSINFNDRPTGAVIKYLIYHYTERDLNESLRLLTQHVDENPVSAHYLICEAGEIYSLVTEEKRAWHAGRLSAWEKDERINATSIGIELVNPGHGADFPAPQMAALEEMTRDILTRHAISPFHILAHSDVAPDRKIDPGDRFDWRGLAQKGIGVFPEGYRLPVEPKITELQEKLNGYGYKMDVTGLLDQQTEFVLRAFQLHFGYGDWTQIAGKLDWLLEEKRRAGMLDETLVQDQGRVLASSS